ncbi:MAG: hypothetical protein OJF49_004184 [Ktedonobacterales bacterium]|jgi:hypothetical protein|nr:MAG: hypothetical protein OJF49_004184 [Ktedonobacterales bacterium]
MKTQSPDTTPEAERVQIELLRRASPARRLELAMSLSQWVLQLSWQGIRELHPEFDEHEVRLASLASRYVLPLAERVRISLLGRTIVNMQPSVLAALVPVIDALEQMGIPYYIGGSVASSLYGRPRSTMDVDLVADLKLEHVKPFIAQLQNTYYVDELAARDAIQRQSSFNLIHFDTTVKIDVFVLKSRPFDHEAFSRIRRQEPGDAATHPAFVWPSPEDTILAKLEWYRMGGETSERQWLDIQGILKVQANALDLAYMRQWAATIGVADLLARALDDAGLAPDAPPTT